MVTVEDRTKDTLVSLIEKWIAKGSVIISDCWKSYDCLSSLGYEHKTVNHSEHFVDPISGACTNNIEREWLHCKKSLPTYGVKHDHINSYLSAYMWRVGIQEQEDVFLKIPAQRFNGV